MERIKREQHCEKRVHTAYSSAVNHHTGAYEVEEMGVWEQRQLPVNIPPSLSLLVHLVPPIQCTDPTHQTVSQPPTFPLPVCLPCFDSRPRAAHAHAQHCSSINKRLPFPLSTPLYNLKGGRETEMKKAGL